MKTLTTFFTVLFLSVFILISNQSKADGTVSAKSSELSSQIVVEITEVLQIPYLKFEDKDLNGIVKVICRINGEGRIIFKDVKGINENLVSNIVDKLNSLNLWTSPDYSSDEFIYIIKYRN